MTDDPTLARRGSVHAVRLAGVALFLVVAACSEGSFARRSALVVPPRTQAESDLLHRMLIAEDARVSSTADLASLVEGMASESPGIRRIAARALGRLEREALVPQIAMLLGDADPGVRAEAANALAQAVLRADPATGAASVRATLLGRLASESDPGVRAAIVQSAARTRHAAAADVVATADAIVAAVAQPAVTDARDLSADVRVAKGFYLLVRQPSARGALPEAGAAYLRQLARTSSTDPADAQHAQRVRTLAVGALVASGRATAEDLTTAFADAEPLVRREAILAAPTFADAQAGRALLTRGLTDPAGVVRYDALRGWGRALRGEDCQPIANAVRDPDTHVALLAIDLFAGCPMLRGASDVLDSLALTLTGAAAVTDWHRAAHALVSLAAHDAERATERLLPFVANRNPFVRTYAARAAAAVREATTLRLLARDSVANVRVAALEGLAEIEGRDADALLIQNLGQDDPQLLMTTAGLLRGSRDPAALPALLVALERVSARRRETERDARMALLDRIQELGGASHAERLSPLLRDYDPAVAERAGAVLAAWTGTRPPPAPQSLTPSPLPTPDELDQLERSTFTVEMADGGSFDLRLRAWDAPTNAERFARLAATGYFDGLTYHRVAANFVVQGGSPGANEYAGDGPFTRDELGLDGNWRGTVGLSTRGRDTGDGQMFFNVVDNVRLDHEYTVWAEVVRGMEVVDRMQEGATIRRITRTGGR